MNKFCSAGLKTLALLFFLFSSYFVKGQDHQVASPVLEIKKGLKAKDSTGLLTDKMDASIKKFNKKAFSTPELKIGQQIIYQQNAADSATWQGILNLGVKFNTFGLPIDFNLAYQTLPQFGSISNRQQLFNFKYQNQFSKIKSSNYLNQLGQTAMKQQLQEVKLRTKAAMDQLIKEETDLPSKSVKLDPSSIKQLMSLPEVQLEPQLDILVEQAKQRSISKLPWDNHQTEKKDSINADAQQYKQGLLQKIRKIRAGFAKVGIKDKYLKDFMAYTDHQINEEQMLDVLVKNEIEESPFKKGFSNWSDRINDFNVGQFSQKLPFNQLNQDQFLNGFQISLKTNRGPVSVGFAKENNLGGLNEAEFNQTVFSSNKYVGFFKTVIQSGNHSKGTLSVAGTSTAYSNDNSSNAGPSQNTYAVGFEQTLNLPKAGELKFELNKSFSKYNDATITDFKGQFISDHAFTQIFSEDFSQSLSGGLYHQMDLSASGLSTDVYVNYSGVEFQNPGNSAFNQPRLRWGAKIKKTFFDRKLSFSIKTDRRSSSLGNTGNGWSNQLYDLESRVKITKKSSLTFKYQNNSTENSISSNTATTLNSGTKKYQISGYTGFKLAKLNVSTQFNMALQNISLPSAQMLSKNIMFTLFNTISVGKQSFTASLFMNKDRSATPLIGNLLNADIAWQYLLAKEWALSTGVTYLDNQKMARQVGGKQSLQFSGIKNMDLSLFMDLRKNLIQPTSPVLAGTARGELALTYYLRKK